jgi:hypothetical protein
VDRGIGHVGYLKMAESCGAECPANLTFALQFYDTSMRIAPIVLRVSAPETSASVSCIGRILIAADLDKSVDCYI